MIKLLAMAEIAIITLFSLCTSVYAADLDEITGNMVLETSAQAILYEDSSDESKVVASLEAGTVVFTTENAENNWCNIATGEYTGYIKVEYLKTLGDQDLINQEFEQSKNDNHKIYDEIQQLEEQKAQTEIWIKLIVGLVIAAIVVVGILQRKES